MRPIPWKPAEIRIEHQSSTQTIKSFASAEAHVETAEPMSAVKCLGKEIRRHQIQDILAPIGRIHDARQCRKIGPCQMLQRIAAVLIIGLFSRHAWDLRDSQLYTFDGGRMRILRIHRSQQNAP